MNAYRYVKEVPGGWEVKLGAGIFPFVLTREQYETIGNIPMYSTATYDARSLGINGVEDFHLIMNGYAAVREYLDTGDVK